MRNYGAMKLRVGRLAGAVDDDSLARAGETINDAILRIKRERPWSFLRSLDDTITLVAGTDIYDTPAGLLNVTRVYYLGTDDRSKVLHKVADEEFVRDWEGNTSGEPQVYRLVTQDTTNYQNRLQVAGVPSAAHISTYGNTLYIEQTDDVDELVSDSDYTVFPPDFYQAIEYLGAGLLCMQQGDHQQAQAYLGAYDLAIRVLKADDVARYGSLFPVQPVLGAAPNSWRRAHNYDYQRIP